MNRTVLGARAAQLGGQYSSQVRTGHTQAKHPRRHIAHIHRTTAHDHNG
ncbi:hypothetical protein AB0O76_12260 [Streptomyces sp. NPDC086554]